MQLQHQTTDKVKYETNDDLLLSRQKDQTSITKTRTRKSDKKLLDKNHSIIDIIRKKKYLPRTN